MVRKILGGILILYALLSFIGGLSGENNANIVTYAFQVIIALSGVFLICFDNVYRKSYIEGFRARKSQCSIITFFMIVEFLFFLGSVAGMALLGGKGAFYSPAKFFCMTIISGVPFIIYCWMFSAYVLPYNACRKYFLNNNNAVEEYLRVSYQSFSQNGFVMADSKALFFPELYCVIPKEYIKSVELKKVLFEQDVYFHLINGKKFYMVTKQYENIMVALGSRNSQNIN